MKNIFQKIGAAAALQSALLLGSIGGTPRMGDIVERSVQIGGVGAGKNRKRKRKQRKIGQHRRTGITGKPWIPSLDLSRFRRSA